MNIVLFDDPKVRAQLLPFTFTRPVADIRVGILTVREKWETLTGEKTSFSTQGYLSEKFPQSNSADPIFINGALCPDSNLLSAIKSLKKDEAIVKADIILAARTDKEPSAGGNQRTYSEAVTLIDRVWKIFQHNGAQIAADFNLITGGRKSQKISDPHTKVYGEKNIFVEEGALIQASVLNATSGPVFIGKGAEIQEGSVIRGPFVLCEGSVVNMGAKIKGDTTIGPHCKVGGEISNSVLFGYSNKAHDGFIGNTVIGEWCNLGADTNVSNLKNNYENVKLWDYTKKSFSDTGLMFCGLMLGDHSKCGINTMFNTGTVAGVGANIFGDGYPRTFIPSFSWGGREGLQTFQLNKVFETASKAMERRGQKLSDVDKKILSHVFEMTASERNWEKKA